MKILMFTWEFPPLISGGLGMACYGMVKALLALGIKIDLVLPTREMVYFPLREEEDVDKMPAVFMDPVHHSEFLTKSFQDITERLEYIGITPTPETYFQLSDMRHFISKVKSEYLINEHVSQEEHDIWDDMTTHLIGEEDLIKKVQEYTQRAERFARELDYNLIHVHDWLTYPSGMLARKISGKPLISHIHATEFDRAGGPGDERIHKIEHAGMTYSDRVIAVSQYTAQMIMSRYRIDTGKIRIVHNAFSIEENQVHTKKRIFKGPTVLFLGRITLQKGPDYYLDVAERVLKVHPEARFIMAGTGDMARKLLRRSAQLKLKNRFLFTGFLNRKQVESILRAVDIYVLPSVSEPFGISPLEAMAFGITSIISKQSGVAEVVNHAFKIDYWDVDLMADTINHLIENPQICKKMGIDGMKEVNRIHWNEAAEKIRMIYSQVLSEFLKSNP
ncbi:MAG: glycosyltransferase [Candidatus Cloacimonetes bacterium]|nr:glycosyltransferase [Candidatus Cloacimonadota bacterium]HNZ07286.1 glycosyltransferase [Candidatus Cloacimonadota bacterium]HOH79577.1 glycosyltransferase [Candidatus Cloacimonadota bacterium]